MEGLHYFKTLSLLKDNRLTKHSFSDPTKHHLKQEQRNEELLKTNKEKEKRRQNSPHKKCQQTLTSQKTDRENNICMRPVFPRQKTDKKDKSNSVSRRHILYALKQFWWSQLRVGKVYATDSREARPGMLLKYPTVHKTASNNKDLSSPKCQQCQG